MPTLISQLRFLSIAWLFLGAFGFLWCANEVVDYEDVGVGLQQGQIDELYRVGYCVLIMGFSIGLWHVWILARIGILLAAIVLCLIFFTAMAAGLARWSDVTPWLGILWGAYTIIIVVVSGLCGWVRKTPLKAEP